MGNKKEIMGIEEGREEEKGKDGRDEEKGR